MWCHGGFQFNLHRPDCQPQSSAVCWKKKIKHNELCSLYIDRKILGKGIYDGLNIPKEQGDTALSILTTFSYILPHIYFDSESKIKGIYLNINTPIELNPEANKAYYLDLIQDIIIINKKISVIDKEKFEEECASGTLQKTYCMQLIQEIIQQIEQKLSNIKLENTEQVITSLLQLTRDLNIININN